MDNFLDEILSFQSENSVEVKKFVANFIEAVCKKEPDYFPKLIDSLKTLLSDETATVSKKAIQVSTLLYNHFLIWLSKSKITEENEAAFECWSQIKNYIFSLIDLSENDGIRTQCIKFIENVVICQTKRDMFTSEGDFSLDQITFIANQMIDPKAMEDEAIQLFDQLINFQAKIHISSVNLMATIQSLTLIARQRSKFFFNKVILAFEKLSTNLPPTLAKSQVNSVNRLMKLLLLILFKHPFVYSSRQQAKLSQLLLNIGASQSEISRCLQDVRKRGIKIDSTPSTEIKRIKIDPDYDTESVDKKINLIETSAFNLDNSLNEFSKKLSRHDLLKALDITNKDLIHRLENINVVCDLILTSLHLLPDRLNDNFRTALNSSLSTDQISEISKHLSLQLTGSGIGIVIFILDFATNYLIYSLRSWC